MDQAPTSKKRQIIAALAVLIVIVVIVGAVAATNKKTTMDVTDTADKTTNTTNTTSTNDTTTSSATYKDGTYSATGSYESPGGNESISVSVTLKNGVVTDSTATSGAGDPEAKEYQSDFIGGYKTQVVGKKLSSIKLSRVSGSSLTSQGFNSAIEKIESEAKA